jgi:3-amino-4-hydroxybenzoic acid synthase
LSSKKKGFKTALLLNIDSAIDLDNAAQIKEDRTDFLIVKFKDETNIPLELLIAKLQDTKVHLLKYTECFEESEVAFGVMETGANGVLINTEDINEIIKLDHYMANLEKGEIKLTHAKVTKNSYIGMGYRACIDTTYMLKENQGMIIGSTSNGGLLISSETHYLPYMDLRPFRVNAGAIHSYVWTPGNSTKYISELKSGDKVLAIDTEGNYIEVNIGRVKIEIRPLLIIEAECNSGHILNAIVQDDWHIRIFGPNKKVYNASMIKEGDELLAYTCEGGRHVGIKIDEHIIEK